MSKLQIRAFVYQLACFAVLFIITRFLLERYSTLEGIWIPLTAFVVGTLLSPKFQVVKSNDGERLFMRWLFVKGFREIN